MEFKYYYGSQADQFSFIRIPRILLTEKIFSTLSLQAKVLYGLLLDRMGLSMKNGWVDKENRVYIIYQISEIQEDLGFSKKKAIDYLAELEVFGLIEKKRRGLGLASIIYVKSFIVDNMQAEKNEDETSRSVDLGTSGTVQPEVNIEDSVVKPASDASNNHTQMRIIPENTYEDKFIMSRSDNLGTSRSVDLGTSRGAEIAPQEVVKWEPQEVPGRTPLKNYNNINNTYLNNTKSNHILSNPDEMRCDELQLYQNRIKENIGLDILCRRNPHLKDQIVGIYELILETVMCQSDTFLIASNYYPTPLVRDKFLRLDASHVEYVMQCLQANTTDVKNIKKYLLAALFNAPTTIDGYYQAEVNRDCAARGM